MKKLFFLLIFYTFPCLASIDVPHYSEDSITTLPILYQGRCRPLEAYARSLLHTFYQRDEFLLSHRQYFEKKRPSAVDWLIDLQTHGHSKWDDFPLFYFEGNYLSYNSLPKNLEGELLEKKIFYENFPNEQLHLLPDKKNRQWHTLAITTNKTAYSDSDFKKLKQTSNFQYKALILQDAYASLAGRTYLKGQGKSLHYPYFWQLKLEQVYHAYPWIEISISLYGLSLLLALFSKKRFAWFFFITAFLVHTSLLAIRCFILERAPVSNMFETVLYVPWICSLIAIIFIPFFKNNLWALIAACFANILLQFLLRFYSLTHEMEPLQAVLDSHYWLIIHVLMVVGSYGLFILAGLLSHIWIALDIKSLVFTHRRLKQLLIKARGKTKLYIPPSIPPPKQLQQLIIQSLYIGTTLLVSGTILGGVWAAESWGRFWDWDPKESWAFISSCYYLTLIHAYRYRILSPFFVSVASVFGMLIISFTWYGVNYILGTGLHSYGFGNGGTLSYSLFILLELLFLVGMSWLYLYLHKRKKIFSKK